MFKKKKILIVDNDPALKESLQNLLEQSGNSVFKWKVDQTRKLERGLKRLTGSGIDFLFLNLCLPDSQGLETLRSFQKLFSKIPIIIISDSPKDLLAKEALRNGADDVYLRDEKSSLFLMKILEHAEEKKRLKEALALANKRLEKLSLMDPVTELLNLRGLQEILSHEVHRAKQKKDDFLVLFVDLDDFKKINDSLGHAIGDVVLKEVAKKLKASLRATDYVARIGGDEFMILLPETHMAEGVRVAEKVRLSVSTTTIEISRKESIPITASLRLINLEIADIEGRGSLGKLFYKTHLALQKSKKAGKNRVFWDSRSETLSDSSQSEMPVSLMASPLLEKINQTDTFQAHMQPIFRLSDMTETGCELLSRFSIQGFEMPDDFFRASMEANALTEVDHHCLKSCVTAAQVLPASIECHVNLFPSTILNVPVETLLDAFQNKNEGQRFYIEISEQQIIGDPSYLTHAVLELRKAGIGIALDDLGFGRSCLESLIFLEPDLLKIDKKCVIGIADNPAHARSLKRLLKIAESLGAEVVAEGIENEDDLDVLKDLGVAYGQGFLLGQPEKVPVEV